MADDFDPYYQWLGISRRYQPPTYYRLLGLEPFETHPDVIETAADQRMAHIRSFQSGPRGVISQQILNELSAARLCLLDADSKRQYDSALRERLAAQRAADAATTSGPQRPADERWARDLAADVKAASQFAARQADRLRLVKFTLPEAYQALGADVRASGRFAEEFKTQYTAVAAAQGRRTELEEAARLAGRGMVSRVKYRAQLETAARQLNQAVRALGEAAYREHGKNSGASELVDTIDVLVKRLAELDAELARLERSRSGRWLGPKALAGIALAIVAAIVFSLAGDLLRSLLGVALLVGAAYAAWTFWKGRKKKG